MSIQFPEPGSTEDHALWAAGKHPNQTKEGRAQYIEDVIIGGWKEPSPIRENDDMERIAMARESGSNILFLQNLEKLAELSGTTREATLQQLPTVRPLATDFEACVQKGQSLTELYEQSRKKPVLALCFNILLQDACREVVYGETASAESLEKLAAACTGIKGLQDEFLTIAERFFEGEKVEDIFDTYAKTRPKADQLRMAWELHKNTKAINQKYSHLMIDPDLL